MKFCQSMKYNMRNVFVGKSYGNCGGEASPRPFYKKSQMSISVNQQSEMLWSFVFLSFLYDHV